MSMIKKSISITDKQAEWVKSQIMTGHYGNESEVFRELIRERQIKEYAVLKESSSEIDAIRAALIKGEKSGFSEQSIEQIWIEARQKYRDNHA